MIFSVNDVLQVGKTPSYRGKFDMTTEGTKYRLDRNDILRKGSGKAGGSRKNRIDDGERKKNPHKWNYYRENEKDYDKIYWDSIDNHVEDEAVGGKRKQQQKVISIL